MFSPNNLLPRLHQQRLNLHSKTAPTVFSKINYFDDICICLTISNGIQNSRSMWLEWMLSNSSAQIIYLNSSRHRCFNLHLNSPGQSLLAFELLLASLKILFDFLALTFSASKAKLLSPTLLEYLSYEKTYYLM